MHGGRRSPLRVVPLLAVTRTLFGYGVNWGSVWGGIWTFLQGVTTAVKNFVIEAIQKAVDLVYDAINTVDDVYHAITGVISGGLIWAQDMAINAKNAVENVVEKTLDEVSGAFSNFRDQLKSVLEHGWDDLKKWVLDPAGDFLSGVLGDGLWVIKAFVTLGRNGVDFLISLAEDPVGTIWGLVKQSVLDTIGAIAPPLEWVFGEIWDLGIARAQAELNAVADVFETLRTLWPYFEWFATHPPNEWGQFADEEIPKAIRDFAGLAANLVRDEETGPENVVRALLGLPKKPVTGLIAGAIGG